MKFLSGKEENNAEIYFDEAIKEALKSTCLKSKCGSVIVKDEQIIGRGFNSPPKNLDSQRKCLQNKKEIDEKVTDKTCCVHAEQRAILNTLKNNSDEIKNSTIYFIRLDEKGNKIFAEKPYCTICSKMALDVGIREFILWHEQGICIYNTEEYNLLSFSYKKH